MFKNPGFPANSHRGGVGKVIKVRHIIMAIPLVLFHNLAFADCNGDCTNGNTCSSGYTCTGGRCCKSTSNSSSNCTCSGTRPSEDKEYTDSNNRKYTCKVIATDCHDRTGGFGGQTPVITPIGRLLNTLSPIQTAYATNHSGEVTTCEWVATYGNCTCNDNGYTFQGKDDEGVCLKSCSTNAECGAASETKISNGYKCTVPQCTNGVCKGETVTDVSCNNEYYKKGDSCEPCKDLSFALNSGHTKDGMTFYESGSYNSAANKCGKFGIKHNIAIHNPDANCYHCGEKAYGYDGPTQCTLTQYFTGGNGAGKYECSYQ